jgi:hydroxymethylglutaryl-CoA reductase
VLPKDFRKRSVRERKALIDDLLGNPSKEEGSTDYLLDLADVMVESAIGTMPVPVGVAGGFRINGREYAVPLAVEEPSVVAAATYAGRVIKSGGGFEAWSTDPVMTVQIAVADPPPGAREALTAGRRRIAESMAPALEKMTARGGGFRDLRVIELPESGLVVLELDIDTRDAMGANIVNTAGEAARGTVEELSGGTVLMAILTNASPSRRSGARFRVPVAGLGRGGRDGATMARRVVAANQFAGENFNRAVTHNKGIMNGIASLVLATGNDTRAVEAAAHAWAARSGSYGSLTTYWLEEREEGAETTEAPGGPPGLRLVGELELPMALGTVGGAASIHPTARKALDILSLGLDRRITAGELGQVAVAVGLAQNLAALLALVGEGIQGGHMRLHARRLAFQAGARGGDIEAVAREMAVLGTYNLETAGSILLSLHS